MMIETNLCLYSLIQNYAETNNRSIPREFGIYLGQWDAALFTGK